MSNVDSDAENEDEVIPQELLDAAEDAIRDSLPEKSKSIYEATYQKFLDWMKVKQTNSFSETVFLAYFKEISSKVSPSTLWPRYSMIGTMLKIEKGINIKSLLKIHAFLKKQCQGYVSKQAKAFTSDDLKKFLAASDEDHLDKKVYLILCTRIFNNENNVHVYNNQHIYLHIGYSDYWNR